MKYVFARPHPIGVSNDYLMGDSTESDDEARKKALLPKVQQAAPGIAEGRHRHHRSMVREENKWMEVASSEGWESGLDLCLVLWLSGGRDEPEIARF